MAEPTIRYPGAGNPAPTRRLRRAERREQIITAATRAFARTGFTATQLGHDAHRPAPRLG